MPVVAVCILTLFASHCTEASNGGILIVLCFFAVTLLPRAINTRLAEWKPKFNLESQVVKLLYPIYEHQNWLDWNQTIIDFSGNLKNTIVLLTWQKGLTYFCPVLQEYFNIISLRVGLLSSCLRLEMCQIRNFKFFGRMFAPYRQVDGHICSFNVVSRNRRCIPSFALCNQRKFFNLF